MNTKPYALSALIALILSSPLTVAAETEVATQPCPAAEKTTGYPPEMQAMRDSFDKIRAARTPAEREQAIQEMQAAREASFKALEAQYANPNPEAGMPPFPGAPAAWQDPAAAQYQAEQQKQAEAARAQYDAWVKAMQAQQQQQADAMTQYRAAQEQQAQAARAQYEAWVKAAQAQQPAEQQGAAEMDAMRAQHDAHMKQMQADMAGQFPQQPGFAAYADPQMQARQAQRAEFHQKMQGYADKLAQARNPEEFQALLAEQRAFVQSTRQADQGAPVAYNRNHCGPRG